MCISRASALSRRRRARGEAGFTLIETMVALVILAIVAAGLVPLLVVGAKASQLTRLSTTAKNITAARVSTMRTLPYHVAYSNGPFVDLLDEYYANVATATTAIPTGGKGVYVAAGTGTGGVPTGAYYQVSFTAPSVPSGFTQVVDTQFLVPGTGGAVTPPSNYSNQASAAQIDQPPSLLVGVTVLTTWTIAGTSHSYRIYTEIGDSGNGAPLVVTQAGASALTVSTATSDGTALSGLLGQVGVQATLSTQSAASAKAVAAQLTRTDPTGVTTYPGATGASLQAVSPPSPSGSTTTPATVGQLAAGTGQTPCTGWASVGPTVVSNVSATVADAQPRAPSNVEDLGALPVTATLKPNSGTNCSGLYLTNVLAGTTADPALGLAANPAVVLIPDSTGNTPVVSSTGKVDTPAQSFSGAGSPVTSAAGVSFTQEVDIFPGLPFVPTAAGHHGALVAVTGLSATISCASNAASPTATSAGTLYYWSAPDTAYKSIDLSLANTNAASQLAAALSTTVRTDVSGTAVPLSSYISSWSAGQVVAQQPSGAGATTQTALSTIPAVLSLVTAPTIDPATYPEQVDDSAVTLALGKVSCVAQDNR